MTARLATLLFAALATVTVSADQHGPATLPMAAEPAQSAALPSVAVPSLPALPSPLNDPLLQRRGSWGQAFLDQWGLRAIGLVDDGGRPSVIYPDYLEPVTVALIDSGVDYRHPDLGVEALWRNPDERPNGRDDDGNGLIDDLIGWNYVEDNNNPWDDHGHGTHLAGVIAAGRDNGLGISGIAPNARLMVLKVVDAGGYASGSHIAQAVRYAADKGARLIQLSLGGQVPGPAERAALEYARQREVVVITAAGNRASGDSSTGYEALPGALMVGALDPAGQRAGFSDWGPALDLLAPGVDILSLRARGSDFLARNGRDDYRPGSAVVADHYYRATGTSFAAPFVTGLAALILGRDPWLEPVQLERMLLQSARELGPPGLDQNHGYGALDAAAALEVSPDRFVEAALQYAEIDPQRRLRIVGTADADQFFQARLDYGVGEAPESWRSLLSQPLTAPRRDQDLVRVDPNLLPPGRLLTLRLQTQHLDGGTRESRLQLVLPGAAR